MVSDVTVILGDPALPDHAKPAGRFTAEDFEAIERMKAALSELQAIEFTYLDNHQRLLSDLIERKPGFVFNLCDTGYRNEASQELHVPALLDILGIPYTGAGPVCLGLCYDKAFVRAVALAEQLPVPVETLVSTTDQLNDNSFRFPALIKPNRGDGSIGITRDAVVHSEEEVRAYVETLHRVLPGRDVLIQEFLEGTEYEVALIGNPDTGFIFLPPLEVDYSGLENRFPRVLAYESKVDPNSPYWTRIRYREARVNEDQRSHMRRVATVLFARLGCRDYGRFDFRTDANGVIKLLEVNPNPAWCWDGKLNFMAEFAGYSYADLLRLILEAAEKRVFKGSV